MIRADLTPKELEALALIAQGHDAKSAANQLSISPHTIYERLRRAREKMGARNSREAARLMFTHDGETNENLASGKFVLADPFPISAFAGLLDPKAEGLPDSEQGGRHNYRAASSWMEARNYLPLRGPGERVVTATKLERLRLIGDLSSRLALAFVAICLAAMVLSTLLQRN